MTAPLTTAKHGSTRCVGCSKLFSTTPDMPIVDTTAEVPNKGHVDSVGQIHRGIGTHAVTRRWHAACLEQFEQQNAAYRAQVQADREEAVRSICEAAGIDYDTFMASQTNA